MRMRRAVVAWFWLWCFCGLFAGAAGAQSTATTKTQVAKEIVNPISKVVRLQFLTSYEPNIGPTEDGRLYSFSLLALFPIKLSDHWDVVTRTIIPAIHEDRIFPGAGSQNGLGDTRLSLFLSPRTIGKSKIVWGAGPIIVLPTATNRYLGGGKWGLGPTAAVVRQSGGWTYGAMASHVWSTAGEPTRSRFSTTFLQPFLAYTTGRSWTATLTCEPVYSWTTGQWTVPIFADIGRVFSIFGQPVNLAVGPRYWATGPLSGPKRVGFRVVLSLVKSR